VTKRELHNLGTSQSCIAQWILSCWQRVEAAKLEISTSTPHHLWASKKSPYVCSYNLGIIGLGNRLVHQTKRKREMNSKEVRDSLHNIYLEWTNNYLTIEKFAEHLEIPESHVYAIVEAGRVIHNQRNVKTGE